MDGSGPPQSWPARRAGLESAGDGIKIGAITGITPGKTIRNYVKALSRGVTASLRPRTVFLVQHASSHLRTLRRHDLLFAWTRSLGKVRD